MIPLDKCGKRIESMRNNKPIDAIDLSEIRLKKKEKAFEQTINESCDFVQFKARSQI